MTEAELAEAVGLVARLRVRALSQAERIDVRFRLAALGVVLTDPPSEAT